MMVALDPKPDADSEKSPAIWPHPLVGNAVRLNHSSLPPTQTILVRPLLVELDTPGRGVAPNHLACAVIVRQSDRAT